MKFDAYMAVAGLPDVGYRFYSEAEAAVGARQTAGIVDAGEGWYSVLASPPAGATSIRWDALSNSRAKARETISASLDISLSEVINDIAEIDAKIDILLVRFSVSVASVTLSDEEIRLLVASNPPVEWVHGGPFTVDEDVNVSVTNAPLTAAQIAALPKPALRNE